jgi:hypothetical protein
MHNFAGEAAGNMQSGQRCWMCIWQTNITAAMSKAAANAGNMRV